MNIKFLYFKGCPNSEGALNLLREVLNEKSLEEEIEIVEIKSEDMAKEHRFLGSPTIQINGMDIEKERRNDTPSLSCRLYRTRDGYSGIPPKKMIVNAIEEMLNLRKNKQKVLFICTHNSARSQMAEGLLKALRGEIYEPYSAGTEPKEISPYAIKVMEEIGIEISTHRSKSIEEFKGMSFDYVVTVCDHAKQTCPFFPGGRKYIHKGFEDPSDYEGSEEEKLKVFRRIRDEIKEWIEKTFN